MSTPEKKFVTVKFKLLSGLESPPMKIKMKSKLRKAFEIYAYDLNGIAETMRFHLDGARLTGDETPEELDLEDNDHIQVMTEQTGGRSG